MRPSELEYTLWLEPPYPEQAPNPQPLQTLETFVRGTATQLVINDLVDGQPRRNEIPLT